MEQQYNIKELKKELGLSDKDISEFFGLKNAHTYRTSSAKQRYDKALCRFHEHIKTTSTD